MKNIHGEDNGLPFITMGEFFDRSGEPPCAHSWGATWWEELRSKFCRKCHRYNAERKVEIEWLSDMAHTLLNQDDA